MDNLIVNQLLAVVVTLGWASEGLPYWALVLASIKVECCFLLSDVYSFNSPSCVVCLHLLHCGCFPVYLVLCFTCMYSNPILCHSNPVSFLLTASLCSLSLSPTFFQFLQCTRIHIQRRVSATQLIFSSMLVVASLSVPGLCGVFL